MLRSKKFRLLHIVCSMQHRLLSVTVGGWYRLLRALNKLEERVCRITMTTAISQHWTGQLHSQLALTKSSANFVLKQDTLVWQGTAPQLLGQEILRMDISICLRADPQIQRNSTWSLHLPWAELSVNVCKVLPCWWLSVLITILILFILANSTACIPWSSTT